MDKITVVSLSLGLAILFWVFVHFVLKKAQAKVREEQEEESER